MVKWYRLSAHAAAVTALGLVGIGACSTFSADESEQPDTGAPDVGEPFDASATDALDALDAADVVDAHDDFPRSPLVPVTGNPYFIEATEVTVEQFRLFKAQFGPEAGAPWSECPKKTALGPKTGCGPLSAADDRPINCVDYCDAKSYCASIGRRLCGRIGGGRQPAASAVDSTSDQWYRACRGAAGNAFPYGNAGLVGVCNTSEVDAGGARPASELAQCQGSEPGMLEMSGNVAEWEDACGLDDGGMLNCAARGGSFKRPLSQASCAGIVIAQPSNAFDDIGFRCCVDQ